MTFVDVEGGDSSSERTRTTVSLDGDAESKQNAFDAGIPCMPEQDFETAGRESFSSPLQYILSVIGLSVGLGTIWRFPAVAYENGGGAFLIPYLCMGLLFGLPMLYIDSTIGQFTQNGPSIAFKQYLPAAQGLGWTMTVLMISIGFMYIVPITWSFMYIVQLVAGRMELMSSCTNEWNTIHCDATTFCKEQPGLVYFNQSCISVEDRNTAMRAEGMDIYTQSSQEEFFYFFIAQKHASFSFGSFNWMFASCLFACWTLIALGLMKGVKSLGKISLVTTFLPYIIITILFIRGITLDGAEKGIEYFLTKPDWAKILELKTWIAALTQSTFSLSIGSGPMIMMSSTNKRSHPNYRDCVILLGANSFMSIIGGITVFSILGSMAQKMGKDITTVIDSPLTLAFIAYPEATSHMPASTLWALLFFCMMLVIGLSMMFAVVEVFATFIIDFKPSFGKRHWAVVAGICLVCYALNLLCFAFQNGYHIFALLNKFLASVSVSGTLLLEMIIITLCYGARRFFRDAQCMHGLPASIFSRIFGNLGLVIKIGVAVTAPILALAMSISICVDMFSITLKDTINHETFNYPSLSVVIGYILASLPLILVPIGAYVNYRELTMEGKPLAALFRITDDHPSLRYSLPAHLSWKEFLWPTLVKIAPTLDAADPIEEDLDAKNDSVDLRIL